MKDPNKKSNKTVFILVALLTILLLSSILGVFVEGEQKTTINVYVTIVTSGTNYGTSQVETDANNTLYNLLGSVMNGVELEQDGDIKCLGTYCNNFLSHLRWIVFLNDYPNPDLASVLYEDDEILVYYGEEMNFGNITISLEMPGINESNQVLIRDELTIEELLSNPGYNATILNNSIICLFNACNNNFNAWKIAKNNEIIGTNTTLEIGDNMTLSYN